MGAGDNEPVMVTMGSEGPKGHNRMARRLVGIALATLCGTITLAGPVSAGSPDKHMVQRIRSALVDLEHALDRTETSLAALEGKSKQLDAVISSAERSLAKNPLSSEGTFSPGLSFLVDLVRLDRARVEREAVEAGITDRMERIQTLTTERDEHIAELQVIVRRARNENRVAGETTPADGRGPLLDVHGSLITYSADWEAVSMCESGGHWHIDSQFDGGLQFHPNTWIGFGGGAFARHAYQASKPQQIAIAERVLAIQGPRAWPNCFRALPVDF
jgi:Transglycosylase-like domain